MTSYWVRLTVPAKNGLRHWVFLPLPEQHLPFVLLLRKQVPLLEQVSLCTYWSWLLRPLFCNLKWKYTFIIGKETFSYKLLMFLVWITDYDTFISWYQGKVLCWIFFWDEYEDRNHTQPSFKSSISLFHLFYHDSSMVFSNEHVKLNGSNISKCACIKMFMTGWKMDVLK